MAFTQENRCKTTDAGKETRGARFQHRSEPVHACMCACVRVCLRNSSIVHDLLGLQTWQT